MGRRDVAEGSSILDIRTYALHPGKGREFQAVVETGSAPLQRRHGIDVVAHGPSRVDEDRYVLIRRFPSLERREEQLARFYGSREWLDGYEERVTSLIAAYHTVVVGVTDVYGG